MAPHWRLPHSGFSRARRVCSSWELVTQTQKFMMLRSLRCLWRRHLVHGRLHGKWGGASQPRFGKVSCLPLPVTLVTFSRCSTA